MSCSVSYGFQDKSSIPDTIKTIKINTIGNTASYVNPQISPNLTEKLRQKIINQTKLTNTNNENADWEISGEVREYSVSTSGVSSANGQQQASINRLTVGVHVTINKRKDNKVQEYDVSRSFDFSARQSLQTAEAALMDEMIRNLTDEIFNRLFSEW
jgi:outer membrane lipopolysaccharide assembly protein LptE/RlpB